MRSISERRDDALIRDRMVPALAVGWGDVKKRVQLQEQIASVHQEKIKVGQGGDVSLSRLRVCLSASSEDMSVLTRVFSSQEISLALSQLTRQTSLSSSIRLASLQTSLTHLLHRLIHLASRSSNPHRSARKKPRRENVSIQSSPSWMVERPVARRELGSGSPALGRVMARRGKARGGCWVRSTSSGAQSRRSGDGEEVGGQKGERRGWPTKRSWRRWQR
jgi:nuclear pore complex protein Nup54